MLLFTWLHHPDLACVLQEKNPSSYLVSCKGEEKIPMRKEKMLIPNLIPIIKKI
jgi:hypothetical protein